VSDDEPELPDGPALPAEPELPVEPVPLDEPALPDEPLAGVTGHALTCFVCVAFSFFADAMAAAAFAPYFFVMHARC
jgi:hypothetical protein